MDPKEGVIDLYQNLRLRFPNLHENVKDKQVDILFRIINNKHTFGRYHLLSSPSVHTRKNYDGAIFVLS